MFQLIYENKHMKKQTPKLSPDQKILKRILTEALKTHLSPATLPPTDRAKRAKTAIGKGLQPLKVMRLCQCLDNDGKQCKGLATRRYDYHGSHELYGYLTDRPVGWVRILVCTTHYKVLNG